MTVHHERYSSGSMLELGAATGALSIYIRRRFPAVKLCTSDIDDGGDVEVNIKYNFERNGLGSVPHVAHTWGRSWQEDSRHLNPTSPPSSSLNGTEVAETSSNVTAPCGMRFKFIVASDILLYVR